MEMPSFILPGNDSSHAYSASWALKELMPNAVLWDLLPERQNGANTLEEILRFTSPLEAGYLESRASARS
jgi:cytochrome P450